MAEENPTTRLKRRTFKTAILVIHGIGEQDPYETMDSFARGLTDYFRETSCDPSSNLAASDTKTGRRWR